STEYPCRLAIKFAQAANSTRVHSKRWSLCRNCPAGSVAQLTLYSAFGVVTMTHEGWANSKTTRSHVANRARSRCSMTSTSAAAPNPASLASRYAISLRSFLREEAADGFPNKVAPVLQISSDDRVALWMRLEPAFAMFEKFLELFLSDEIVLLIVEHGHEDVEVRQQLGKATL